MKNERKRIKKSFNDTVELTEQEETNRLHKSLTTGKTIIWNKNLSNVRINNLIDSLLHDSIPQHSIAGNSQCRILQLYFAYASKSWNKNEKENFRISFESSQRYRK
jgi:hypothetical protein